MDTLANRNNNPGNIKDTKTGQFKQFATPQEGYAALLNDLQAKQTGTSTTGIGPDSTLADFAKVYAPAGDNNNPAQYTVNLANHMKVRPDTKLKELNLGQWADSIANAEGYKSKTPTTPKQTFSSAITQIQKDNPKTQPEPSKGLVRGFGNLVTGGGTETLGKSLGTNLGYAYEKVKGLLGGQDNSKYYDTSQPSVGETVKAGLKTGGAIATIIGGGELANAGLGLLRGGSALASEPVTGLLTKYAGKESISSLSAAEKVEALTKAISDGVGGQQAVFQKALQELAPQVLREAGVGSFADLNPGIAKALGLSWKAVKLLGELAIGGSLYSTAKGLINK